MRCSAGVKRARAGWQLVSRLGTLGAALALFVAGPHEARAADDASARADVLREPPSMRRGTIRVGADAGYALGVGALASSPGGPVEAGGVGAGLRLALGLSERLSVGWAGDFQQYGRAAALGEGSDLCGTTTGLEATWHLPARSGFEPWLRGGAGYRIAWIEPGGQAESLMIHGPQLVRLAAGIDFRLSRALTLGPVVGGDLTHLLGAPSAAGLEPGGRTVSFLFAGVQGHVDVAGPD